LNSATLQLYGGAAHNLSSVTVVGGTADIRGASFNATTVTLSGGSVTFSNGVSVVPVLNLYSGTVTANSALSITSALVMGGGGANTTAVLNVAASRTTSLLGNLTFTAQGNAAIDSAGAEISGPGRLSFAGTRTLAVHDSANADYDLTISTTIAGGSFYKTGAGTLYLAGANLSSTANTLTAGRLVIGNNTALGTGALIVTGGTISGDGAARTVTNSLILRNNLAIEGNSDLTFAANGTNGIVTVSGGNRTLSINNAGVTRIQSVQIGETNANRTLTLAGSGRLLVDAMSQGSTSGGSNLVVKGAGLTVTLAGTNSYAGGTTLRSGSVYLGHAAALGTSTSAVIVNPASAGAVVSVMTGTSITLNRNFEVTADAEGVVTLGNAAAVTSTFNGNITFSQTINLSAVTGGTAVFNGTLDDGGALSLGVKVLGGGTVVLNGSNVYTGITTVVEGALIANSQMAGQVIVLNGASFTGVGASSANMLVAGGISALNSQQSGEVTVNSGQLSVNAGGVVSGQVTVEGGSLVVNGGGTIANETGIVVYGGTLQVTGGSISGEAQTTVGNSGTVVVGHGGTAAGTIVIESSGTLKGSGGTVGAVVVQADGTLAPGESVGQLTIDGNGVSGGATLVINGGAHVLFEFNDAFGTAGGPHGWDLIDLGTGMVDLNGASSSNKINLDIVPWLYNNTGIGPAANFLQWNAANPPIYEWLFIRADNLSGATPANVADLFTIDDSAVFKEPDGSGPGLYYRTIEDLSGAPSQFRLVWKDGVNSGLYITFQAVPEPSSCLLAGIAAGGFYWRRRKKKASAI
jgi:autotransporter-associated beta strand protein